MKRITEELYLKCLPFARDGKLYYSNLPMNLMIELDKQLYPER